ncbi:MAG: hemin uptake protein HemP [Candidatus Thiodiazotropha sp.]
MNDASRISKHKPPHPAFTDCPRIQSRMLFGRGNRIAIEHRGSVYHLHITRMGRLILTK